MLARQKGICNYMWCLSRFCLTLELSLVLLSPAYGLDNGATTAIVAPLVKEQGAQGENKSVQQLQAYVQANPKDAEALLNLGIAYKKAKQYAKAKVNLRLAWRCAPGTVIAEKANQELLSLPSKIIAPKAKHLVARIKGKRVAPAGLMRVKLLAFYASWAQPCKQLQDDLKTVQADWKDKVEFVSVDVDDPKNEQLLDEYDVSPIPTVVFIGQDGKMVSFLIGYAGRDELVARLRSVTGEKAEAPTG